MPFKRGRRKAKPEESLKAFSRGGRKGRTKEGGSANRRTKTLLRGFLASRRAQEEPYLVPSERTKEGRKWGERTIRGRSQKWLVKSKRKRREGLEGLISQFLQRGRRREKAARKEHLRKVNQENDRGEKLKKKTSLSPNLLWRGRTGKYGEGNRF